MFEIICVCNSFLYTFETCLQIISRKTCSNEKRIGPKSVGMKRVLLSLKQVQKDMRVLSNTVNKVRTDQLAIKANIKAFRNEITNLTEIVTKSKENVKKTIRMDETFVMPAFPHKSVVATRAFNEDCASSSFCDQVVRNLKEYLVELHCEMSLKNSFNFLSSKESIAILLHICLTS